jgi:hypothetical protein
MEVQRWENGQRKERKQMVGEIKQQKDGGQATRDEG